MFLFEQDIKTEMNPALNSRAAGPEASLIGIPGIVYNVLESNLMY